MNKKIGEIISERIERIFHFAVEDATAASIDKTGVSPKVELFGNLDDKIVPTTNQFSNSIRFVLLNLFTLS